MTDGAHRRFVLQRHADPSGVSGCGLVAFGVQFPDGTVVTRWNAAVAQTCVWSSTDDVLAVHGHGGATELVWIDPAEMQTGGVVRGSPPLLGAGCVITPRVTRTHTTTSVYTTGPCGHRVPVPNEAYHEAVELDPCEDCGAVHTVQVLDVDGTPTPLFNDALALAVVLDDEEGAGPKL